MKLILDEFKTNIEGRADMTTALLKCTYDIIQVDSKKVYIFPKMHGFIVHNITIRSAYYNGYLYDDANDTWLFVASYDVFYKVKTALIEKYNSL